MHYSNFQQSIKLCFLFVPRGGSSGGGAQLLHPLGAVPRLSHNFRTYIQAGKSWDRIRKGEKERDGGGVRCWALWSLLHFCLSFSRMREQTMKDWRDMLIRLACQPFTPLRSCDRYMCLPRGAHNLFCTVLQGKFTVIVPRCPIMPYRTRTGRRRGPQLSYG